jgi:hypothetical protein
MTGGWAALHPEHRVTRRYRFEIGERRVPADLLAQHRHEVPGLSPFPFWHALVAAGRVGSPARSVNRGLTGCTCLDGKR